MTRAEALRRIRACLRLTASDEPHEAAAALRQAQALMAQHGITADEVDLADVQTATRPAGRALRPAAWLVGLANMVGAAMGACALFDPLRTRSGWTGRVRFVAVGPRAEIAAYAFTVCARQLADGRRRVLHRSCRLKRATRMRRANLWCEYWVEGAARHVQALALPSRETALVDAWFARREIVVKDGRAARPDPRDVQTMLDGLAAGAEARLHPGVPGGARPPALPGQ